MHSQTTVQWKNSGSNSIDSSSNWVGNVLPSSSQIASFSSATFSPSELQLQSSSVSFAGIQLTPGAGALTFTSAGGGSAKTMSIGTSGVVNSSTSTLTFEVTSKVNIALFANASFTADGPIVVLDDSNRTTGFNIGAFTLTLNGTSTASSIEKGFVGSGGSVVKAGTGTWTIAGANTYTGATTISGGTLRLGASGSGASSPLGTTAAGTSVTATGASLDLNGFTLATAEPLSLIGTGVAGSGALINSNSTAASYGGTVTISTGGATIGGTGHITLLAALAGDNPLTKSGANTLTLSAASTRNGTTQIDAGTLRLAAPAALGDASQTLTLNGGTLDLATDTSVAARPVAVTASSTLTSDRATAGSGLTHTLGTLAIGTGTLSVNAGANVNANTAYGVTFGATTLSGNATFDIANQGTATGTLTLGAVSASGTGTLTKNGAGTLVFAGENTFAGGLTLNSGSLIVNGGALLAAPSVPLTVTGGTLELNNSAQTISLLQLSGGNVLGPLTLGATGSMWSEGSFNGTGTLTIAKGADLTLTGAAANHDFNGHNIVNAGIVNWSAGNLRGGNGSVFTNESFFYDLNGGNKAIAAPGSLGGTFSFTNNGTYQKTVGGTTTVEVPFTNNGALNIAAGAVVFASTFSGTGQIKLTNGASAQFSSPLVLSSSASLSGTGTINAPSVSAGGPVAPGVSPGTLNITGDLTLLATSALLIEIGGPAQGVSYDFLSVGGSGTLAGDLKISVLNGYQWSVGSTDTFTILTAGNGLSGAFANVGPGQRVATFDGTGSFQVNYGASSLYSPGSVVLSSFIVTVPEPSTWALLGLGIAFAFRSLRRRR